MANNRTIRDALDLWQMYHGQTDARLMLDQFFFHQIIVHSDIFDNPDGYVHQTHIEIENWCKFTFGEDNYYRMFNKFWFNLESDYILFTLTWGNFIVNQQ